jgi:hypothetical protein
MPIPPTHEDANLILRLYELRREPKLRQARDWFAAGFHARTLEEAEAACPPDSEQNAYMRMVTSYWEMAASFLVTGVLNPDLFFESGQELLFVWEKIRPLVPAWREKFRNPQLAHNLERAAAMYLEWGNTRAPEFYGGFGDRVRGPNG